MLDPNQKYFLMSFRFNKTTPEAFGLIPSDNNDKIYLDSKDNSRWIKMGLYDFGWGSETGFVRLPKLGFNGLWYLLTNSTVEENRYGAAALILSEHSAELLAYLTELFNSGELINDSLRRALEILKLEEPINRSRIVGKKPHEIEADFQRWNWISEQVLKIKSTKT